ncbi:MAG TPA: IS1595 family transposase [Chthonomonadaceae bacterium]|nr:IS1595 family transposase [Chthonomonadaceae bacterium]
MQTEINVPTTLQQAIIYFSDPDIALEFMVDLCFPNGPFCRKCGCLEPTFLKARRIWQCKGCKKQFSVKTGTIFEDSPIGLDKWICTVWMLANSKNGVSSCEVARSIGVTQKTAWFMLHRIRRAMEAGSFEKLDGQVECDETYIGGKARNMHGDKRREQRGRGFPKTTVFGLRQRNGEVRTMVVPDATKETLQEKIEEHIEEGAEVFTDTARAYNGLSDRYAHRTVDHGSGEYVKEYDGGKAHINAMEGYWSLLDRCYHGTYVIMSPQHQERYLAEEDFRYNTRKQKDGERFLSAMYGIIGRRLTYEELTTSHLLFLNRGEVAPTVSSI